jgi:hypothetical protein
LDVPSWSVVEDSLLHFKTVRVSVESLVVVEVSNRELSNDLVAVNINLREAVHVDNKLDGLGVLIDGDKNNHLLFKTIEEDEREEASVWAFSTLSTLVDRVLVWLELTCKRSEDVVSRVLSTVPGVVVDP